ncbi:receptor-like protein 33 [Prosopis cineraria]|uniref:receptor-like protein 33 n=1 Tax=Prosopis cineraria TaxID=364024 RepID=UPI00240F8303|nr:receptor-like protein 33 [Prosopis cineraria]
MEFFHLSNNSFQGELTSSICNATSLEFLSMSHNYFTRTIPYCISSSLQVLNLSHNKFICTIPHCIGNSSLAISVLDLQMNRFSGTIPQLFEKGNNLMTLNLDGNMLEGKNSGSYWRAWQIEGTQFSHNRLIGASPSSIGNLRNLESLDLSSNKLVENFPLKLASFDSLGFLNLSRNKLEGCVPMVSHFETLSSDSFKGNKGLHGFQLDTPCYITHEKSQPLLPSSDTGFFEFGWQPLLLGFICGASFGTSMFWV